jgi:hypothetical protein
VALEASGLGSVSINVRITAVRKLAVEAADNGLLAPELAAGISRVKGAKSKGVRVGNWLSLRQAQALLTTSCPSGMAVRIASSRWTTNTSPASRFHPDRTPRNQRGALRRQTKLARDFDAAWRAIASPQTGGSPVNALLNW